MGTFNQKLCSCFLNPKPHACHARVIPGLTISPLINAQNLD